MQNSSQPLSKSTVPSLLTALTSLSIFRDAAEYAATRYCETMYQHQTNVLSYQSGDGMSCHGWFNRGFAEKLARMARKSGKQVLFIPKTKKGVMYVGDFIMVTKHTGQTRFDVNMEKRKYQLLHMTGTIDEANRTLTVFDIGKARIEYLKFQSSRVQSPAEANLFNQDPDDYDLIVDDDKPTRIILVTQVAPMRDKVTVWACLPTKKFDMKTCVIELAELEKLCEKPVIGKRPPFIVTPKQQNSKSPTINVTRKKVA